MTKSIYIKEIQNVLRSTVFFPGTGSPTEDVSPASGTVHFVSNSARENIVLTIIPDDLPEGVEVQ